MMAVIIALLAVGFFIGAVGIVKGIVWVGVIGFALFVVSLVYGAVLSTR